MGAMRIYYVQETTDCIARILEKIGSTPFINFSTKL
jgi:hypothetical protein